jgi:hypothetical protein
VGTALEPFGLSPGVSERGLPELENGCLDLEYGRLIEKGAVFFTKAVIIRIGSI